MNSKPALMLIFLLAVIAVATANPSFVFSQTFIKQKAATNINLQWREPPVDNPLRGLVPYASQMPWFPEGNNKETRDEFRASMEKVFPHSVEFAYFALADFMMGDGEFDWSPIDKVLTQTAGRGCQCTFRVYLEYPGQKIAIPQFLIDGGLKVHRWKTSDGVIHTPDYEDPKLRKAIKQVIAAMGERYDGDPRIACLTVGMLGLWGEWHDYPKSKLFASKAVQTEVLDAYEAAFKKTKLLLRYPAGDADHHYAANADRDFGYHDDSFAWATIRTGKPEDDWFFGSLLESAGRAAVGKWKTNPIGGEIRPETWGCVFEDPSCSPKGQEFDKCVGKTHVSWLMDSGMFLKQSSEKIVELAKQKTAPMGYRLTFESAKETAVGGQRGLVFTITNRGVAPFYYDWPVETAVLNVRNEFVRSISNDWKLPTVMPGQSHGWRLTLPDGLSEHFRIGIRVPNPMQGGFPLRFGNKSQMLDGAGWMVVDFDSH